MDKACGVKASNVHSQVVGNGYYFEQDCTVTNYIDWDPHSDKKYQCIKKRIQSLLSCAYVTSYFGLYSGFYYQVIGSEAG